MQLSDASTAICSSWSSSATAVAVIGSASGVVTGLTAGTAIVSYNVPSPCGGIPAMQTITVNNCALGAGHIASGNQYGVSLFPNPAQNELTIRTDGRTYSSMTIANDIGQTLVQQQITGIQTTVNIKDLPAAIYFITLHSNSAPVVKRFVKMD